MDKKQRKNWYNIIGPIWTRNKEKIDTTLLVQLPKPIPLAFGFK